MCFSATASFTASAGLGVMAALAITSSKSGAQRLLAFMPLIFALQQFFEGMLWLSLMHTEYMQWRTPSMHLFLVFAQVVWPVFVPLSMLIFEKDTLRRKILQFLLGVGVFTSLYFGFCLLFYNAQARIEGHHIKYLLDFPFANKWYSGITYILAAAISPFFSSIKRLRILGYILTISYILTYLIYRDYLISVWCYFGAVLSVFCVIFIISEKNPGAADVQA